MALRRRLRPAATDASRGKQHESGVLGGPGPGSAITSDRDGGTRSRCAARSGCRWAEPRLRALPGRSVVAHVDLHGPVPFHDIREMPPSRSLGNATLRLSGARSSAGCRVPLRRSAAQGPSRPAPSNGSPGRRPSRSCRPAAWHQPRTPRRPRSRRWSISRVSPLPVGTDHVRLAVPAGPVLRAYVSGGIRAKNRDVDARATTNNPAQRLDRQRLRHRLPLGAICGTG